MNTIIPISQTDERLESASRWVLKMDEGLSEKDREALKDWLAEHPKNAGELLGVAKIWDKMDDLSQLADLFPHDRVGRVAAGQEQARLVLLTRRPVWTLGVVAVAASLVIAITAAYLLIPGIGLNGPVAGRPAVVATDTQSYETAIGEQSNVVLPDGTVVILNTNSRIEVGYSDEARVLLLERGEIHVDVAEENARPLSVVAGDRIVQAVGTSFSVEITEDQQIELVVTEGKVVMGINPARIRAPGVPQSLTQKIVVPPVLVQTAVNTLAAGERIVLGVPQETITEVTTEEIEVKLSWREGRLIFRSEPLVDALAEVERYTLVKFVLLDEDLKTRSVSGRFRAGDVEALLVSLRLNFNIVHEVDDDGRVLLSSL